MKRAVLLLVLLALAAAAWLNRGELLRLVPTPLVPLPPHEQYTVALRLTGLAGRAEGRAWIAAAERALERADEVALQHERTLALEPGEIGAAAWRFEARRGQRVTIEVEAGVPDGVFIDLFQADGAKRVASAPARSATLSHVVGEDGELIARVQRRIGWAGAERGPANDGNRNGRGGPLHVSPAAAVTVAQRAEASLLFPVEGVTARAVQSGFGAGRDSGRRRHEGIDIFAPRGTPVVAAADGWITRRTTNRLGGNVVWLWVPGRRMSLYYAHLDRQAVTPGERVAAGDIVGYVGSTGNARGTRPHLHFGVYAPLAGAVDPYPFVVDPVMHRDVAETRTRR